MTKQEKIDQIIAEKRIDIDEPSDLMCVVIIGLILAVCIAIVLITI